jgi:hypothetical protein
MTYESNDKKKTTNRSRALGLAVTTAVATGCGSPAAGTDAATAPNDAGAQADASTQAVDADAPLADAAADPGDGGDFDAADGYPDGVRG